MDEGTFRAREPWFIRIAGILKNQYPEGSQVFEVIQNADDAGATQVTFALDLRTHQVDSSSLKEPKVTEFYTPSLLVFNNSKFEGKDWKSLQSLGDSQKREDPSKTGEFGLGFNSNFHITDFPSILSGDQLAYMDPNAFIFEDEGKFYKLHILKDFPGHLAPFDIFLPNRLENGIFDGTVIRLPLRTGRFSKESKLKKNEITTNFILKTYFLTLLEKSSSILLFLKNITSIDALVMNEDGKIHKIFDIFIENKDQVTSFRTDLVEYARGKYPPMQSPLTFPINIKIEKFIQEVSSNSESWILSHFIDSGSIAQFAKQNSDLHSLKLIPWAGIAVPISHSIEGKAFCFLPLPISTNLPVHVHGYFQLDSSRSNLWKRSNNIRGELESIKATWNQRIFEELLTKLYQEALLYLVKNDVLNDNNFSLSHYYDIWCFSDSMLTNAFFQQLNPEYPLFYSTNQNWISLNQVYFFGIENQKVYEYCKEKQAQVLNGEFDLHSKFLSAFRTAKRSVNLVSPPFIRNLVLKEGISENLERSIALLFYIIEARDPKLLHGLNLLPLMNNYFTTFEASSFYSNKFYLVPSEDLVIFSELSHLLINTSIDDIYYKLQQDWILKNTNIVLSKGEEYKYLLDLIISQNENLNFEWIIKVWELLIKNNFISHARGLKIVITTDGQYYPLENGKIVGASSPIDNIISKLKIPILAKRLQKYYNNFSEYFLPSSSVGYIESLKSKNMSSNEVIEHFTNNLNNKEKTLFRNFLETNSKGLDNHIDFIKLLPIFEKADGELTSLKQGKIYIVSDLPKEFIKFSESDYVLLKDSGNFSLLQTLGIPRINKFEFYVQLIPYFREYINHSLLKRILIDLNSVDPKDSIIQKYRQSKIIPNNSDDLNFASNLYDPTNKKLKNFLEPKAYFPHNQIIIDQTLASLKNLGLKTELEPQQIIQFSEDIEKLLKESGYATAKQQSIKLFNYLNQTFPATTWKDNDLQIFKSIKWLPCESSNSERINVFGYNFDLEKFYSLNEIYSFQDLNYVSTLYPVLLRDLNLSENFKQIFNSSTKMSSKQILNQIIGIRDTLSNIDLPHDKEILKKIENQIEQIYKLLLNKKIFDEDLKTEKWIWTGESFVSSSQIRIESPIRSTEHHFPSVPFKIRLIYGINELFTKCGVRKEYEMKDYIEIIRKFQNTNDIELKDIEMIISILEKFYNEIIKEDISCIPSKKNTLVKLSDIVYIDNEKLFESQEFNCEVVHDKLSKDLIKKLKISSFTEKFQSSFSKEFGEEFGQNEELVTRIRNIITEYQLEDDTLIKEMLQNADDAKATKFYVLVDKRTHKADKILGTEMKDFNCSSILFYNDQPFTEEDLIAVQALGEGRKREDRIATGKFGLGMNVCYHVTDVPSFVTGSSIRYFDPHKRYLPGSNLYKKAGRSIDFLSSNFQESYPDTLSPFIWEEVDCTMKKNFNGTLFRFPLRTTQQARTSKISTKFLPIEKFEKEVLAIKAKLEYFLIFLKNIKSIKLYIWETNQQAPKLISSSTINLINSLSKYPTLLPHISQNPSLLKKYETSQLTQFSRAQIITEIQENTMNSEWLIVISLSNQNEILSLSLQDKKLLPLGGVALKLERKEKKEEYPPSNIYCFLPLPCDLKFPCFVNGYFNLSSNRRDLWYSAYVDDKTKWNLYIFQYVICPSYLHLLDQLKTETNYNFDYSLLFPSSPSQDANFYIQNFYKAFYTQVLDFPLFRTLNSNTSLEEWLKYRNARFHQLNKNKLIIEILLENKIKLFNVPSAIYFNLKKITKELKKRRSPSIIGSQFVRNLFKQKNYSNSFYFGDIKGLTDKDRLYVLMNYCYEDKQEVIEEFKLLPFLPLAEERRFGTFHSPENETFLGDKEYLELFPQLKHKFTDLDLLSNWKPSQSCLKELHLIPFAPSKLISNLKYLFYSGWKGKKIVDWDQNLLSRQLLLNIIKFIKRELFQSTDIPYPIIPSECGKLLSLDCTTLFVPNTHENLNIYEKIGFFKLDSQFAELLKGIEEFTDLYKSLNTLQNLGINIRSRILNNLNNSEKDTLLILLFHQMGNKEENKRFLCSLSLFEGFDGQYKPISNNSFAYLKSEIKSKGFLKKFPDIPNVLKYKENLKWIYELLHINQLDKSEFFIDNVLPNWHKLTLDEQHEIIMELAEEYIVSSKFDKFKLIPDRQGTLQTILFFVNSEESDFLSNVFPNRIITLPYDLKNEKLLRFLKANGLRDKVDWDLFIEAAEQISKLQNRDYSLKFIIKELFPLLRIYIDKQKSNSFYQTSNNLSRSEKKQIINQLSTIKFVPLTQEFREYYSSNKQFSCFSEVAKYEERNLVFSQMDIIDKEVDSTSDIFDTLNTPSIEEKVVDHFIWLIQSKPNIKNFDKIISQCYKYFDSHTKFLKSLSNYECILLENGKFVHPSITFFEVHEQIPGYLFKVPDFVSSKTNFLKAIGVREKVTIKDYAQILCNIKKVFEEKKLDRAMLEYVKHILHRIRELASIAKEDFDSILSTLCAPNTNQILIDINNLVFINDKKLFSKLNQEEIEATHEELEMKTCSFFNIKFLSTVIIPKINLEKIILENSTEISLQIESTLKSKEFSDAVILLFQMEKANANYFKLESNLNLLSKMKIQLVKELICTYYYNEKDITKDGSGMKCIIEKAPNIIYLQLQDGEDELASQISNFLENPISDSLVLKKLLKTPVDEISDFLIENGIESSNKKELQLGDKLSQELVDMELIQDPDQEYDIDEYIAWEESENFYLGKIKGYKNDQGEVVVEIGENQTKVISSVYIYKFEKQRPEILTKRMKNTQNYAPSSTSNEFNNTELQSNISQFKGSNNYSHSGKTEESNNSDRNNNQNYPNDSQNTNNNTNNARKYGTAKEEFEKLSKLIKEQMNKLKTIDERKNFFKRLYLQWHPDKNPGYKDLAEEVFKFISNQKEKYLEGKMTEEEEIRFNFKAKQQQARYNKYTSGYNSYNKFNFSSAKHPNRKKSASWMNQAESDLQAANNSVQTQNYDVACFLSHQVAEKALKSAIYFKDEDSMTNTPKLSSAFNKVQTLYSNFPFQTSFNAILGNLEKYFEKSRYPYSSLGEFVPSQQISLEQALEAVEQAKQILNLVNQLILPNSNN